MLFEEHHERGTYPPTEQAEDNAMSRLAVPTTDTTSHTEPPPDDEGSRVVDEYETLPRRCIQTETQEMPRSWYITVTDDDKMGGLWRTAGWLTLIGGLLSVGESCRSAYSCRWRLFYVRRRIAWHSRCRHLCAIDRHSQGICGAAGGRHCMDVGGDRLMAVVIWSALS
jgi:hypothetical protein